MPYFIRLLYVPRKLKSWMYLVKDNQEWQFVKLIILSNSHTHDLPRSIMLFPQWLISQLYLHYFEKLKYCTLEVELFSLVFFAVFALGKLSQCYFVSFMDPLVSKTLHPLYCCLLTFAQWIFSLVEKYQVKSHLTVINYLKTIL